VVKVIDLFPDEVAGQPALGGYQLMVSADIFRGRYRESLETAKPIAPNQPLLCRFALPTANHVFLPGHRIMVQVQSSWFPLYDRNPQTFVPSIFWAKPGGLPEGRAAGLPRARPGELRRAAFGRDALKPER
jgi:predicted acyl esterase